MLASNNERKTIIIREKKQERGNWEFNSDFPEELTGIIDPDEFQQSIVNINNARRSRIWEGILICSVLPCSLVGLALLITGSVTIATSIKALWISLLSVGSVMCVGFCCITLPVVIRLSGSRLQNAVDEESMKYSMNLPVPTVWRLGSGNVVTRISSNNDDIRNVKYFLLIDIDRRAYLEIRSDALNSNSSPSNSTSTIGQQSPTLHLSQPSPSVMSFSNITLQPEVYDRIHSSGESNNGLKIDDVINIRL